MGHRRREMVRVVQEKELVPEGEIVEFSDDEYVVSQVYHYARVNRAIVIFNE